MQFRRPRRPEEPVPRVGANPHNAGEPPFEVAKFHRAQQRGEVAAERAYGRAMVRPGLECHDQEDRGTGERRGDRLRDGTHKSPADGGALIRLGPIGNHPDGECQLGAQAYHRRRTLVQPLARLILAPDKKMPALQTGHKKTDAAGNFFSACS